MPRIERGFSRNWGWSVFHRCMPPPAYMIDVDTLECCRYCKEPIFLAEVARDVGQTFKATTIIYKLAKKTDIAAFLVFYKDEIINEHLEKVASESELIPKDGSYRNVPSLSENQLQILWNYLRSDARQIFRVRQIYPQSTVYNFRAQAFYDFISALHHEHELTCCQKKIVPSTGSKS